MLVSLAWFVRFCLLRIINNILLFFLVFSFSFSLSRVVCYTEGGCLRGDKSHFGQRLVWSGGSAAPQHAAPPSRNTVPAPAPTLAVQRIHYAVVWCCWLLAAAAVCCAVPLLLLLYPTPHPIIPTLPVLLVLPLPPPPPPPGPHVCIICSLLLPLTLL